MAKKRGRPTTKGRTEELVRMVEEAYRRRSWLDATLRMSIRGLDGKAAAWRPPGLKHSIAENVIHCVYWKNRVRHRICRDRSRSFPFKGSNWIAVEQDLSDARWKEIIKLSDHEHDLLCNCIPDVLRSADADHRKRSEHHILGIALHDVYHTGQIHLIRA